MSPPRWSRRGATTSCRRQSWRAWNECGPSVVVPGFWAPRGSFSRLEHGEQQEHQSDESVVRARCPSDQSAGGVESSVGTARRGCAPVIAPASRSAVAKPCRGLGTTHAQSASGPLTGPAQIESSWSRDYEDGGPTIQMPAAEVRCTLRFRTGISICAQSLHGGRGQE